MNRPYQYLLTLCLCALSLSPSITAAQATTTPQDGSTESRSVRQQRIRAYREQSSELQQKMSALGTVPVISVSMPVLFGVTLKNISPNFGDPRSGGRTHEGEDIMAIKGTPIVSPTQAVVLRTGVGATEGNYVYTANPGNETFVYMHLDRIGEGVVSGAVLAQGALIGYVGNTGNASGGAAHLHFEIHDSSNTPVDPFPRLTAELSLQEKITDLSPILSQTSDNVALSNFLVINFRSTFNTALASNIVLPEPIMHALSVIPASTASGSTGAPVGTLPIGDMDIGSTGSAVVTLQTYLIQAKIGPAALMLANAGATGYFGAITKAALLEFQVSAGIIPSTGYYGAETRAYIGAHPLTATTPTIPVTLPPSAIVDARLITRDLKQGMSGEDVRILQKFLNTHGFRVSSIGAGSLGNETIYFGPATTNAVIRLQVSNSIVPAVGYVGPITRGIMANM